MTDTHVAERNGLDVAASQRGAEQVVAATQAITAVAETTHRWARGHAVTGHCQRLEAFGETADRHQHQVRTDLPPDSRR